MARNTRSYQPAPENVEEHFNNLLVEVLGMFNITRLRAKWVRTVDSRGGKPKWKRVYVLGHRYLGWISTDGYYAGTVHRVEVGFMEYVPKYVRFDDPTSPEYRTTIVNEFGDEIDWIVAKVKLKDGKLVVKTPKEKTINLSRALPDAVIGKARTAKWSERIPKW